ncbi:MAG: allophanate hydrolase subunit 1 [Candidatus Eremiobacteraeota bacterium]|nr:allophanate hydrolase subunit 1 [Candidatus Eremiobacteraeota bacterium]
MDFRILPAGDAAVLAELGDTLDLATVRKTWQGYAAIAAAVGGAGSVLDVVPAYGSVLVRFDPAHVRMGVIAAVVRGALETAAEIREPPSRRFRIGVCFAPQYGLDIGAAAVETGMTESQLIDEFCRPVYRVAFLGFTAGFPYLVGLSQRLWLSRLPNPRPRVPAGSVGVAAGQCGIYPRSLPGGWRIVGQTAAEVFNAAWPEPAALRPGDSVSFYAAGELPDAVMETAG